MDSATSVCVCLFLSSVLLCCSALPASFLSRLFGDESPYDAPQKQPSDYRGHYNAPVPYEYAPYQPEGYGTYSGGGYPQQNIITQEQLDALLQGNQSPSYVRNYYQGNPNGGVPYQVQGQSGVSSQLLPYSSEHTAMKSIKSSSKSSVSSPQFRSASLSSTEEGGRPQERSVSQPQMEGKEGSHK